MLHSSPHRRDVAALLFRVLYSCGLRLNETLSLTTDDVDIDNGIITVKGGKGKVDRYVPMSRQLSDRCAAYKESVLGETDSSGIFFSAPDGGKYGHSTIPYIVDNVQDTIFGGFAPNSQTAKALSKSLGSRTVLSGSVSRSKDNPSESLQMMERPLMTADELKAIPKGTFVVMKTGRHPMQTKLRLFLDWGITFDEPYQIEERVNRKIAYADRDELMRSILKKYPQKESLERPRSRVRREEPTQEPTVVDKPEVLHVPNKEEYS